MLHSSTIDAALAVGFVEVKSGSTVLLVAVLALALAAVHVATPGLVVLESLPRSPTLSFGSGVSVAYVFVHLFPEVDHASDALAGGEDALLPFGLPVYAVVLLGFAGFYGLEQFVRRARAAGQGGPSDDPDGVFWVHVGSFASYNALLGYLLAERAGEDPASVALYAAAIGLHFLVNDHGLRDHHEHLYQRVGRWLLAGSVVAGGALGLAVHVDAFVLDLLVSLLAGSIVLNVIKEELPGDRESRFWAFLVGAVLYTALLATI
jgi:hypothetical protein